MWRISRASRSVRCHPFHLCLGAQSCAVSDNLDHGVGNHKHGQLITVRCFLPKSFSSNPSGHPKFFMGTRHLSSQVGELDTPPGVDEASDDVVSEPAVSDGEMEDGMLRTAHSELDVLNSEVGMCADKDSVKSAPSKLLKVVLYTQFDSIHTALDEWIDQGNMVDREEVLIALQFLRKCHKFGKALKLTEWVEANNHLDLTEDDYASHADLIARANGLQQAESYIESIPESLRGEVVYRNLLRNCVNTDDYKRAERVFDKMKALGFPLTTSTYNQMLVLYKRHDRKKVADLLLLMVKENVKPDMFTYRLLIDIKGLENDLVGMEQVLEAMKANGIEPNRWILTAAVRNYFYRGQHDKAEAILKEIERKNLTHNDRYTDLFYLYSTFGKVDELGRLWKACEAKLELKDYLEALKAWGRLGNVEKAEAVFEKIVEKWSNVTAMHYSLLLNIYADHKMLAKGKDLVKQMINDQIQPGPLIWNALVKLYAKCGKVEKANAFLQELPQLKTCRPLHGAYVALLDKYAERGDVHNAERIFDWLQQCAYVGPTHTVQRYDLLLQAYINAKRPAYGFRERLKADGIGPIKALAAKLTKVEAFMWEPAENLLI